VKRLLLISYHFPPDAEVGGLRAQKYCKYLPCFGWSPLVLTVLEKYYRVLDHEKCADINCEVARTGMLISLRDVYLAFRKTWDSLLKGRHWRGSAASSGKSALELRERSVGGLKLLLLSLLWLPDDRTGWILPAALKGIQLIRRRNIDAFMTTSPPHSVQIIGIFIRMFTGCRWVADFRDPWTLFLRNEKRHFARVHDFLERQVIEKADVIVTATEQARRYLQERYRRLSPDKFVCIPNGYDPDDFEKAKKRLPPGEKRFTFSYIGDFYVGRNPEIFLKAVAGLIREGLLPEKRIRLRFVGDVRYFQGRLLTEFISDLGLAAVTDISDHVPHSRALEFIVDSNVLIVLSPQPFVQPTKVFEYMAAGAFILAFTPPGSLADIVNRYPGGFVIDGSLESARTAVLSCFKRFEEGRQRPHPEGLPELRHYERKNLARILSEHL